MIDTAAFKLPLKWHGGKHYLAPRIVDLMPQHTHYVEPFAGGLSVLLAKNPDNVSEVVNDLNRDLTDFFRVLQCPKLFKEFRRRVKSILFSRIEWTDAEQNLRKVQQANMVDRAVWFFTLNRMSLAGRMNSFTGITKTRTRGRMNAEVNAWLGTIEGLPAIHRRLKRVLIEYRPAVQLIAGHDVKGAVIYCDPPYLACTRTSPKVYGEFEMSDSDHRQFLTAARSLKHAKVLISGYSCEMYDTELSEWTRHDFNVPNNAAGGTVKRRMTESVWCNFPPSLA